MNIWKNISIGRKLFLAFASSSLCFILVIVLNLYSQHTLSGRLNELVYTDSVQLKLGARLNRRVTEYMLKVQGYPRATSENAKTQLQDDIQAIEDNIQQLTIDLSNTNPTSEKSAYIIRFTKSFDDLTHESQSYRNLIDAQDPASASVLLESTLLPRLQESTDALRQLVEYVETRMQEKEEETTALSKTLLQISLAALLVAITLSISLGYFILRSILAQTRNLMTATEEISKGNLDQEISVNSTDELGTLTSLVKQMQASLRQARTSSNQQIWLKTGQARVNEAILGEKDPIKIASKVLSELASYLNAQIAALFAIPENEGPQTLRLVSSYAYTRRKNLSDEFKIGEGLVGQAALEQKQILISNAPADYIQITSGLGETSPTNICVTPFVHDGKVKGVIELGTLHPLSDLELEYLSQIVPVIASAFEIAQNRASLQRSQEELQASNAELEEQAEELRQTTEELKAQQAELSAANQSLETQKLALEESGNRLEIQQVELETANTELEAKNALLERQKAQVEQAQKEIQTKAEDLALASKYKSEFLANMSHELRTPLNSLLLLAQSLSENKDKNLNEHQVESASIIYDSGNELLNLINEILDLSKIEAGRMELKLSSLAIQDIADNTSNTFKHLAEEKQLGFEVVVDPNLGDRITTDPKRLQQVIKNLVTNAIKFTETGHVHVHYNLAPQNLPTSNPNLQTGKVMCVQVADTGIGIPKDKQKVVFEAFQQGDGGDTRRFGGTGLGLSIARELASLLGGEIQLESEPGKGSTFRLLVPLTPPEPATESPQPNTQTNPTPTQPAPTPTPRKSRELAASSFDDDRNLLQPGDNSILVIEDDIHFVKLLKKTIHEHGFKMLAALNGEEGVHLAATHQPHGILLDLGLPKIDGWSVLRILKDDVKTRHIPVHIVSAEEATTEGLSRGAIGHATKPVTQEQLEDTLKRIKHYSQEKNRKVLLVEDDNLVRKETAKLISTKEIEVTSVTTGQKALDHLKTNQFDLVILDLGLPDMDGRQLLERLQQDIKEPPPIIIYTTRDLTREEEMSLRNHADSIILKDVRSQERLLDEVSLFLHWMVTELPEDKREIIHTLHKTDVALKDKKVLVVDDDMRTAFVMSRMLSEHGMLPVKAENGAKAITLLEQNNDIDIVLMDIMMPVMDGYKAMQQIRSMPAYENLPIIALTAKAMKEDRDRCMSAGANDYLPKPINKDRLLSMMRVWLYR